jgi:hypothetical protein
MSAHQILTFAVVTLVSTACNPFHQRPAVEVTAQDATLNTRWHANLASPASLAGAVQMNGTASMAPSQDSTSTDVTLALANATPGGIHPWAVHWGQCGEGQDRGVFGASDAYKALTVESDGRATGIATVQLHTPSTGSYFVVVQASLANPETVVACGNLAPPTQ